MRLYTTVDIDGYELEVWNVPYAGCGGQKFDWRTFAVDTRKLIKAVLGQELTTRQLWNITLSLDNTTNSNVAVHLMKPVLKELTFSDKEVKYFVGMLNYEITLVYQRHNKRKAYKDMTDEQVLELINKFKDNDKIVVCFRKREIVLYTHRKYLRIPRKLDYPAAVIIERVVPNNIYCTTADPYMLIDELESNLTDRRNYVKKVLEFLKEFIDED